MVEIDAIGNSVEVEAVGNIVDFALIDITTQQFFLTTLQTLADHKEVESF